MRDLKSYAKAVEMHANAANPSKQKRQWKADGVRDTPLLRLPYWNPLRWVLIDPMHNLLLGQLGNQLVNVFGLKDDSKGRKIPRITSEDPYVEDAHFNLLHKQQKPPLCDLARRAGIKISNRDTKKAIVDGILDWKDAQTLPLTGLTEDERDLVVRWITRSNLTTNWDRLPRPDILLLANHFINHDELSARGGAKSLTNSELVDL
ncbi:hypothetical protein BKA62DRAFT_779504 [Auriculariales sp. MPI-PUGE-AT-0066]|nr:hypothetical protein BKA62DRAFT_779504 [Auriculariales sp. MPI-PUGE-AT-0066]